jgi:hypothetical protein
MSERDAGFHNPVLTPEGIVEEDMALTVVNLGPDNEGSFGPDASTDVKALQKDAQKPEYTGRASKRWRCVDGRGAANENDKSIDDFDDLEFDPRTPGSRAVTDTAADFMDPKRQGLKYSDRLAINTTETIERGEEIVVHGDEHALKGGCAANAKMQVTLEKGARNVDIIAPAVWGFSKMYGLDSLGVSEQDVVESIVAGGETAKRGTEAFDVTPEEAINIMLANGATYEELKGDHTERGAVVSLGEEEAFDNRKFAQDHQHEDGTEDEAFSASVGVYVHRTVAQRIESGATPREACLHAMRGVAYLVMLAKKIGNEKLEAWALGEAQPVRI